MSVLIETFRELRRTVGPVVVLSLVFSSILKSLPGADMVPVDLTLLAALAVAVTAFVAVLFEEGRTPLHGTVVIVAWVSLLLWMAMSFFWSSGGDAAWLRLTRGLPLVILALVGSWLLCGQSRTALVTCLRVLPLVGVLAALATVMTLQAPAAESADVVRANYIQRGIAMVLATVVAFSNAVLGERSLASRVAWGGLGTLLVAATLAAGSRQSLFALVPALAVVLMVGFRSEQTRKRAVASLAALIGGFAVLLLAVRLAGIELLTLSRLAVVLEQVGGGRSLSARAGYLRSVAVEFGESPLLGHGLGSFGYLYGETPTDYPHNFIAEVAFEGGAFGLVLLLIALAVLFSRLRVLASSFPDEIWVPLVGVALVAFVNALSSNSIAENRLLPFVVGMLAGSPSRLIESRSPSGMS